MVAMQSGSEKPSSGTFGTEQADSSYVWHRTVLKSDIEQTKAGGGDKFLVIFMWGFAMTSQSWPDEFPSPKFSKDGMPIILSVDDEPAILSTRQLILESAGFRVLSAPDGEAALRLFSSELVDLVLLDYVMPGLGGDAVAKEMKRQRPHVPVILVSASPVPEDILTCVDCRCDKGEGPLALLKKVSEFLAHSSTAVSSSEPRYRGFGRDHQPNPKCEGDGLASNDQRLAASVQNSPPLSQHPPEKMSGTLTCWKEIAQYFGKGIRTVQRWEHEAGLPIRRHNGAKGRVFALPHELEVWLQSSTRPIQDNSESEIEKLRKTVADLSRENEMLLRWLAALEQIPLMGKSKSHNAMLRASRGRSLFRSYDVRESQKPESGPGASRSKRVG